MSKRKLSKRQAWRVNKIQQERTERMQKRAAADESDLRAGKLGPEQRGLVVAHYGASLDVCPLDTAGHSLNSSQPFRCKLRANIDSLVTGDEVVWRAGEEATGVIVASLERRSEILRPDRRGNLKPLAANVDHIIIVIAPQPQPTHLMLDRYLIAAELSHITPVILLNKADLLDAALSGETALSEKTALSGETALSDLSETGAETAQSQANIELFRQLNYYESLGIPVLQSSTKTEHGLQDLYALLTGAVNIFVGQSGVGKSSLVNVLLPAENVRVGGLSEHTGLGKHTTTTAKLYELPEGGRLIDSPGIREFGLWHIDPDLIITGMREFTPLLGSCKFRNCQHKVEPGCALREAVAAGKILAERLESYHAIRDGVMSEQR